MTLLAENDCAQRCEQAIKLIEKIDQLSASAGMSPREVLAWLQEDVSWQRVATLAAVRPTPRARYLVVRLIERRIPQARRLAS